MIPLSARRTVVVLVVVIALLTLASLLVLAFPGIPDGIDDLVWVGDEGNIPAWYSSVALLSAGVLAGLIAAGTARDSGEFIPHWWGLSIVFICLSLDEAASFHEMLNKPLRSLLDAGGALYFAWVIAGAVFVIAFGVIYLRFLLHLPARTRWMFLLSAAVYLSGALVTEAVNASMWEANGAGTSFVYDLMTHLEELLEMGGVVLFIYTLLSYARQHIRQVEITFGD